MDPIVFYIIVKFGVPIMIYQKTISIEFRDMKTCQETAKQVVHLIGQAKGEIAIETWRCIPRSSLYGRKN